MSNDKRQTGEGAMKGWKTRREREFSHDDLCRLSRLFNASASLNKPQDYRINEWLKAAIAKAEGKS